MGVCTISQTTHLILMTMMMKTVMLMEKMKEMHKQRLYMTLLDLTNCQQKKEKKRSAPFQLLHSEKIETTPVIEIYSIFNSILSCIFNCTRDVWWMHRL